MKSKYQLISSKDAAELYWTWETNNPATTIKKVSEMSLTDHGSVIVDIFATKKAADEFLNRFNAVVNFQRGRLNDYIYSDF